MKHVAIALTLMLSATPALSDCPPPEAMKEAAQAWLSGGTLPDPGVTSADEAACAYTAYRQALSDALGAPVGVKVGFTSPAAQQAFGVPGPVAGALFAPMLLPDGAEISLTGSRMPLYEADLIVTVGDSAIMQATTRAEAAAALSDLRPFIELPDVALEQGLKPDGLSMRAYGVMPWRGAMGAPLAMSDLPDPVADLAALTVDLKVDGETVGSATGDSLLGHPLDVVLWLVQQGGFDLAPGSVISLGSLGKLYPAQPGHRIAADYEVGGRTMSVSLTLVP